MGGGCITMVHGVGMSKPHNPGNYKSNHMAVPGFAVGILQAIWACDATLEWLYKW